LIYLWEIHDFLVAEFAIRTTYHFTSQTNR